MRIIGSLVPVSFAVMAVMLVNLPVTFTGGLLPAPILALAPVYFWAIVRPDLMPPAAVLVIGLLEDLLSGGPPGLWGAGFLAAYGITDRQRDVFAGLVGIGALLGFFAAMAAAALVAYALASVVAGHLTPLAPLLLESLFTVLIYPLIAFPMVWVHRHLVGPMRGEE